MARDLLQSNREKLIAKALKLALAERPNIAVLLKLMDKLIPTLTSSHVTGNISTDAFVHLDDKTLNALTKQYALQAQKSKGE